MHKVQRTVLIVDNAKEDRMIIRRALRQDASIDYQLLEAENGAQALAYLHQQQPDCLLLGCELPDSDGLALLQSVVLLAEPSIYPIVMLAGAHSTAVAVAAMQQGAHDFVSKATFSTEQLQRAVNNAIEKVALLRQLEEQREWSRLALARVSDALIATDTHGCVTFMNPTAEALTGWRASTAQGQALEQIFRLLDETTRQPIADPASGVLRTPQTIDLANHALLPGQDGRTIPIDYSATPIHDRLGNRSGVLLTVRDLSERKAVEAALRESEARLNTILYNMPAAVYMLTTDHRYLWVNRVFEQENNITGAEICGQSIYDRWPPDVAAALVANEQRALAAKAPITVEESAPRDGETRFYSSIKAPLLNEAGKPYAIIGISTDITERKRAEEALRRSEEQLRAIINAVPGLIAYVDHDQRYQFVNATYGQWFARPIEQIEGYTVQELSETELYQQGRHRLEQVLAGQEVKTEATFTYPDGVTRTLLVNYIPHLDGAGQPQGFYVVNIDISERKQAQAALRISEERFRTLFDTMDEGFCIIEMIFDAADQPFDYRFLEINPAFARFTGLEDAVGKTARQLVPNLEAHWFEIYGNVALTGAPQRFVEGSAAMGRWFDVYAFRFGRPESRQVALLFTNITERKQAEDQLRQQHALLQNVINGTPTGIYVRDLQGRYLLVNRLGATIVGQTPETMIGQYYQALYPASTVASIAAEDQRVLASGEIENEEFEWTPAGMTYTLHSIRLPYRDAENNIAGILNVVHDITARKQAEEALRASEARFRQLANAMPQVVWTCDATGALTYINNQWLDYSGMSFAQTLEQGMWSALHPDDQGVNRAQWQHALESGQAYEAELRLRRADGEYRWHLERAVPIRNDAGVIEQWFGASFDIDDHKRGQDALARANQRFVLAEDASNGWVYDFDVQQGKAERSPGFSRILGYAPEEILPDITWWHGLFHPDDQYLVDDQAVGARSGEEFSEVEYRVRHRDGHYVHLLDRSRNIHNAAGQPVRVVGITVDISERKRAEQALQQFNEQLEQQVKQRTTELTKRLQELDQFAYVASHDLKAPLRALDHLAQWISNDAGALLPTTSLGHLEKMRARIMRMEKLLDDLLAYSRADRYQYTLGKVDVALLLDDIVRLVTPPQGFAVNAQMPLPVLITQKVPLETVLRNLINNAIKHHDRSDGQVQLAVQDLGEFLEFSVSDDGPGIEPEFHERIFQIFQTLKPRDQVEGSGMGLAIVKKLVESRNGHITVTSALGQGATFRFTWPKE